MSLTVELLADGAAALFQDGDPAGNVVQVGAAGQFKFTEGPTWSSKHRCWMFVCIPKSEIYKFSYVEGAAGAAGGELTTFRSPSNHANGMFFDPSTHALVVCEHETRCITTNDVVTGARAVIQGQRRRRRRRRRRRKKQLYCGVAWRGCVAMVRGVK